MNNKVISDIESEKILINQMILDDSIIEEVIQKAPIETFYNPAYKQCYQIILNISGRKEKVDFMSFVTECKTRNVVSPQTLEDVTNAIASTVNWSFYADNVMKCYQSRQLQKVLGESRELITRDNAKDLIAILSAEIDNISCLSNEIKEPTQVEIMCEMLEDLNKYIENKELAMGWNTGLQALNTITEGIKSEYILICARPSMGKTFLAQQISLHFAKEHKILFIELEMSAKQINFRNTAIMSGLRMNDLKYNLRDSQKFARVQKAIMELSKGTVGQNYKVVEPISRKLSAITSYIRKSVKHEGVECVIIDHVGLIQSDSRFTSSWESAREISNGLQKLQRELNIPLIGLSQRSRDSEGGKLKGDLSTIRGSGAYEEDADVIITIEHARATDESEKNKIGKDSEEMECELYVAKNRNGTCGVAQCKFKPSYGRFVDVLQKQY